jgi:phosphoribosylglycinamide formyltransferase 1
VSVEKVPVGVLVSGSGTNLQALLDACAAPEFPARIAVVVSNVPTAFALERARKAQVPAIAVDAKQFPDKRAFEAAVLAELQKHGVQWVCLAGFMRLLGPTLLTAFPERVLNIHPALLPAFPGLHAVRQAISHGVKLSGCTVHLVDEGMDTGPILGQAAVPVLPTDDEASLAQRILLEEHRLYPAVLKAVCSARVLEGRPAAEGLALRNPGNG